MLDRLRFHRRPLLIGGALLAGLLVLLGVAATAARLTGGTGHHAATRSAAPSHSPASVHRASPAPSATDVGYWDAIPPVTPAVSAAYPAITGDAARDPYAFARVFVTELFSRDYRTSRAALIGWAQYEDSPLQAPNYPRADWTKVLVDSLTDLTWDGATDTPIPADGPWLALQAEQARTVVSAVSVKPDPQWQTQIGSGYQPPDPLATAVDVTLTITQRTARSTTRFDASIAVQLGTSARRDGYGVAATNNYVIKEGG